MLTLLILAIIDQALHCECALKPMLIPLGRNTKLGDGSATVELPRVVRLRMEWTNPNKTGCELWEQYTAPRIHEHVLEALRHLEAIFEMAPVLFGGTVEMTPEAAASVLWAAEPFDRSKAAVGAGAELPLAVEIRRWFQSIAHHTDFKEGVFARLLRALREQANTKVAVGTVHAELKAAVAANNWVQASVKVNFLKSRKIGIGAAVEDDITAAGHAIDKEVLSLLRLCLKGSSTSCADKFAAVACGPALARTGVHAQLFPSVSSGALHG